jgi:hypothetical protein
VGVHKIHNAVAIVEVIFLTARELIGDCAKHAVPVSFDVTDDKSADSNLFLELHEV